MLSNYQYLKSRLEKHYEGKSQLKKYLSELKHSTLVNGDFKQLDLKKDCQYLEEVIPGDLYIIRIIEAGLERYRVLFSRHGFNMSYIYDNFGYSDIWGYRECGQRMGFHQEDHIYRIRMSIVDSTDLFPYIDLSKLNRANAGYLIDYILGEDEREYALELIIKSGNIKLAEAYINNPAGDIKTALKYNLKLLKEANDKRLRLAYMLGKNRYQRGMLSYMTQYEIINWDDVDLKNWNNINNYIKEQQKLYPRRKKKDMLSDYSDYLKHHKQFGLPKYPRNLYEAKQTIREVMDKKKNKKNDKGIKKRVPKLFKLYDDDFIVTPAPSAAALTEEGRQLHHCVGSCNYAKRYADGLCDIYFIRHRDDPSKPLVTVELRGGNLVQARSKYNMRPPAETKPLINKLVNMYHSRKEQHYAKG